MVWWRHNDVFWKNFKIFFSILSFKLVGLDLALKNGREKEREDGESWDLGMRPDFGTSDSVDDVISAPVDSDAISNLGAFLPISHWLQT